MGLLFDASPEELKVFLDEAEEQLQTLDEGLLNLEREGSDPEVLQAIFRAAHTLKGSSATLGHTQMARLTHGMEGVLDRLRNGALPVTTSLVDALLQSLDSLRLLNDQVRTLDETDIDITEVLGLLESTQRLGPSQPSVHHQALVAVTYNLSPDEETALQTALMNGGVAWEVAVRLDTTTGLQAARALQVLLELAHVGQVICSEPSQDAVEHEQVSDRLHVLVVSQWSEEPLHDLLSNVDEVAEIIILPYQQPAADTDAAAVTAEDDNPDITRAMPMEGDPGATATAPGTTVSQTTPAASGQPLAKTVRIDVARLDRLMDLVGELVIDRTRLLQVGATLAERYPDDPVVDQLTEAAMHTGKLTGQLQEEIMKGRLLPIETLLSKFPRLSRDLATKLNKRVTLVISGQETELDRSVIEAIGDPLIHLVRNAIDHGIESPEERVQAGKLAEGQLRLMAQHRDNQIVITIRDDGRGMHPDDIKAAAVQKGMISPEAAARLSPAEAVDLIFTPGVSTASQVSDISGRGVGMDIVRTNIEKVNGSVEVASVVGQGTTFTIKLPLTLAIAQALLVGVGDQIFALPISAVSETSRLEASAIRMVQHQEVMLLRERILPLVRLGTVFGFAAGSMQEQRESVLIVAVRQGEQELGLVVDRLVGEQEIVIKPLGHFVGMVPGVTGATILGDGRIALILDVRGLMSVTSHVHQVGETYDKHFVGA